MEEMLEVHYNSRQFVHTLAMLGREFSTPYDMFLHMARFYREQGYAGLNHSRAARYEILWKMIGSLTVDCGRREIYRDALVFDLYLRENAKRRPCFAKDIRITKDEVRKFYEDEASKFRYLKGYESYDRQKIRKMTHLEWIGGKLLLFDYQNRNALTHQAQVYEVSKRD